MTLRRGLLATLGAALLTAIAPAARAQVLLDEHPADEIGVGITEKRGEQVPLDLEFYGPAGSTVRLGDLFEGDRPVVLVLGYYDCPLLCTIVFNKVSAGFDELAWRLGDVYQAVSISIDPTNEQAEAQAKRAATLAAISPTPTEDAWPFLTSNQENVRALAEAVGYNYKYLPESGEYSHPAVIVVIRPDGVVSQYLQAMPVDEKQLRLSLMDAADGKIGGFIDKFIYSCHTYDPDAGSFVLHAMTIMNYGAVATALALGGVVGGLLWAERRKRRRTDSTSDSAAPGVPAGAGAR